MDNPAPFVAEQVKVTPAVSAVRVVGVQPVEDATPDSGSVTLQLAVTLLRYQPLLPRVPMIWGTITGGVVSVAIRVVASAEVFDGSILPTRSRAML